jgi:hypothetical protein
VRCASVREGTPRAPQPTAVRNVVRPMIGAGRASFGDGVHVDCRPVLRLRSVHRGAAGAACSSSEGTDSRRTRVQDAPRIVINTSIGYVRLNMPRAEVEEGTGSRRE